MFLIYMSLLPIKKQPHLPPKVLKVISKYNNVQFK